MIYKYIFKNKLKHYILINRELSANEQRILKEMLPFFPHCNTYESNWFKKFPLLDSNYFNAYPKELLAIAANAYDGGGNTVLGVACHYGHDVASVQKLIDMGADVNKPDSDNKLPLHWAISNKLSYQDDASKRSYEAVAVVQCLLNNGARTDIVSYENLTPLQYAESRGFIAAADLIKKHELGVIEKTLPPSDAKKIQFLGKTDARQQPAEEFQETSNEMSNSKTV